MPALNTATLIVSRSSERDLKFRGIELTLDGEHLGNLLFGRSVEAEIAAGSHTLFATNRLKSFSVEFEAQPGETVRFEVVGIALGGLWLVMTMLGTVAYRVVLERVSNTDNQ